MTSGASRPDLPEPERERWQPLRIGLVDLYLYDSEEFHFHDGHLLLRGNNGAGKSKVLSLTLPFLLDASLSAARLEPDGDRHKRMEWNLLMGRLPQRTGYAWLELGRRDAHDGRACYLTIGCGLRAVAGRTRVDSWYFVAEQRVGLDLWLTTPERVVLDRERLNAAVAERGQVFTAAQDYRRIVDERLFGLGDQGYRALVDTLIELRQPQLSKQPNEARLSNALSNALPALARAVLDDVAEALGQLEEYREEVASIERLREAVAHFSARYQRYARVQARRQARVLRQAQTGFDRAARALGAARTGLEAADGEVGARGEAREARALEVTAARARQAALERDPAMRDAARLRDAAREARARAAEATGAAEREREAAEALAGEREERERRERALDAASERQALGASRAEALAEAIGVAGEHADALALVPTTPAALDGEAAHEQDPTHDLNEALRTIAARRREQIAHLRRRLRERDAALQGYALAREHHAERRAEADRAAGASRTASGAVSRAASSLVEAWREHLGALRELAVADPQALPEAVETWCETLAGDNPARTAAAAAQLTASRGLAALEAALDGRAHALAEEDEALEAEAERTRQGEDRAPGVPPARAPGARAGRPGAPLWQVVEFADAVPEDQRAGLEAALEASGLLDAWVSPAGALLDPDTHDTWLEPREKCSPSLAGWLRPADEATVGAEPVQRLLASIGCSRDESVEHEAWVSPAGRFRVGSLRGAWTKPAAEHVGYAARAAARARRLEVIETRRSELAHERATLEREREALGVRTDRLREEIEGIPLEGDLRDAHATLSAAEAHRRECVGSLAEAEARLEQASARAGATRQQLQDDAADLRLPGDADGLEEAQSATGRYEMETLTLVESARETRRAWSENARQVRREALAATQAAARRAEAGVAGRAAEATRVRHDELQATVGASVAEIERRLAEAEAALDAEERALEEAREAETRALEERARAAQILADAERRHTEEVERRAAAAAGLAGFAATGLLGVALPDLETPEPRAAWPVAAAIEAARRIEQALAEVAADDDTWQRVQSSLSEDYATLGRALATLGQSAELEPTDFGVIVRVTYQGQPERPDRLTRRLDDELAQRRQVLTAREREVIENHLQAEVAASLQRLMQEADRRVRAINTELARRATGTGVRFRLVWRARREGDADSPAGLAGARARLLDRAADAWSEEDRAVVGEFLQALVASERERDETGPAVEHLARALDYRRWHEFRVERHQDGAWRALAGPASSGERALGLTVPLFAAASSHYSSAQSPHAPRLVMLDEAFAGIDDETRAQCMALIREFDLDFVMTSEREWGCYAELPGVSICHLLRRDGIDAVHVSRWRWDGRERRASPAPEQRFPDAEPLGA